VDPYFRPNSARPASYRFGSTTAFLSECRSLSRCSPKHRTYRWHPHETDAWCHKQRFLGGGRTASRGVIAGILGPDQRLADLKQALADRVIDASTFALGCSPAENTSERARHVDLCKACLGICRPLCPGPRVCPRRSSPAMSGKASWKFEFDPPFDRPFFDFTSDNWGQDRLPLRLAGRISRWIAVYLRGERRNRTTPRPRSRSAPTAETQMDFAGLHLRRSPSPFPAEHHDVSTSPDLGYPRA